MKILSRNMHKVYAIALVFSILLSACAAVQVSTDPGQTGVVALGAQQTISGIRAALAEQPGTFIMRQGDLFLLAWPKGSSYAYLFIGKGTIDLSGIKANTFDFARMVKFLENGGWRYVPASALPAKVVQVLSSYTVEMVMTGVSSLTTVFVLPVILLEPGSEPGLYSIQYPQEMIQ